MADSLSILIVNADADTMDAFKELPEVEIVAMTLSHDGWKEALHRQRADILVVELSPKADLAAALTQVERVKSEFPNLSVFVTSTSKAPELIIAAMRAGAQEFLAKPVNPHELSQAVERSRRRMEQGGGRVHSANLVTLFSKTGGVGVTTLAVNLGIALSQASGKRTALIDLNLQHGDAASVLNVNPRYSIVDACESGDHVDCDKLQSCMVSHESGLSLLSEPPHPVASEEVSSQQVREVLQRLRAIYQYVVIDTPHIFEPRMMAALDLSDIIIVVMVANFSSLRATQKVLALFRELGYSPDKVKLLVNRISRIDRIDSKEIQKTLDHPLTWMVPNNYSAAVDAINTGIPLVTQKRLSNVARSIVEMAEAVNRISRDGHP